MRRDGVGYFAICATLHYTPTTIADLEDGKLFAAFVSCLRAQDAHAPDCQYNKAL